MHDQALIWNTDDKLQVTTLTARLRDLAKIGSTTGPTHVSVLWGEDDPFGAAVVAHHWALDGESLSFETTIHGTSYYFELEPLHDVSGRICGVAGRAIESSAASKVRHDVLREAEHVAGIGTWHEDLRTGTVTISSGLASLLGIPADTQSLDIRSFDHPGDHRIVAAAMLTGDDRGYRCDHRIVCAGSRVRNVRERVRTVVDERGVAVARIGTLTDITDLKEREATLAGLVHHDPLTGLPNRVLLEERLDAALADRGRNANHTAVLFIDLDDFKAVNDVHGHAFGDQLLTFVGQRLLRYVRSSDTVARLGGDEFVIIVDELFTDSAALDAARKIMRCFDDPFVVDGTAVTISASIGVATAPTAGTSSAHVISAADREMYAIKRNGGRGVKIFQTSSACNPPCSADEPLYVTPQSA